MVDYADQPCGSVGLLGANGALERTNRSSIISHSGEGIVWRGGDVAWPCGEGLGKANGGDGNLCGEGGVRLCLMGVETVAWVCRGGLRKTGHTHRCGAASIVERVARGHGLWGWNREPPIAD